MPATENEIREEIALLAAIGRGEREALRDLYARYGAALFSLALRLVHDRGAAEEVLQDAFVKVWRHAGSFDPQLSRPFTWMVTILRRTAIDHLRRARRGPALASLEVSGELATGETTRATAEAHEGAERAREILATLPPPQRDALELALFSTLTHAEIAAQLALPVGTVKTWIRRGLLELRTTLNEATS